jgi:hypothetical protein
MTKPYIHLHARFEHWHRDLKLATEIIESLNRQANTLPSPSHLPGSGALPSTVDLKYKIVVNGFTRAELDLYATEGRPPRDLKQSLEDFLRI